MKRPLQVLILVVISFTIVLIGFNCKESIEQTKSFERRPNILFIISDDLSAEALSVYGNVDCSTPNIDQLALSGIQYTGMYSQYPVCGPSRAALMTGMYPQKLGVMSNGQSRHIDSLLGDLPSMTEHFRHNGYTSTRLGKIYHMRVPGDITAGVNGPDHKDSWDHRYNFKGAEWQSEGIHHHFSNEQLTYDTSAHYNLGFGTAFYSVLLENNGKDQPDYRATSKAIDILKSHQQGVDKPFFLSLGYVRPHVPLVAPREQFDQYLPKDITLAHSIKDDLSDIPNLGVAKTSHEFGITSKDRQQEVLAAYYASVSFVDLQVGRLIQALNTYELQDNTIVVFTSDHGYHLGEHEFWQKLSLHEESTRIPFILNGPDIEPSVIDSKCEQIDIYPTLAALADLSIPKHVQGDIIPFTKDDDNKLREGMAYSVTNKGRAIRTDDWTYIRYRDGSEELYDMVNDPKQFLNVSAVQAFQKQKIKMTQLLDSKQAQILTNL